MINVSVYFENRLGKRGIKHEKYIFFTFNYLVCNKILRKKSIFYNDRNIFTTIFL